MASPAIHRTHSVRNWVYLDDINDVMTDLPAVLSMARDDHAANSDPGSVFPPVITTKDDRPVLIWHHTSTSNSHQGTLFIPPEVGTPSDLREGRSRSTDTQRQETMLRHVMSLREASESTEAHIKEAIRLESTVRPNRIGKRGGFTVIGVNDTLGFRPPTTQELVDLYREHGLQHTGEDMEKILTSDLVTPLLRHFENGCRCMEGGAPQ